jgi:HK97 gp10 family phage protein
MSIIQFGSKKLERALDRWSEDILKDVKKAVIDTANMIQAQARALAPVDSGYLRQSIEVELQNGGLTAIVTVGSEYAIYIEYGTGIYATKGNGRKGGWVYYNEKFGEFVFTEGQQAQPFWFPALKEGNEYWKQAIHSIGG